MATGKKTPVKSSSKAKTKATAKTQTTKPKTKTKTPTAKPARKPSAAAPPPLKRAATPGRQPAPSKTARAARTPTLRDEIEASGETPLSAEEAAEREQRDDLLFLAREFLTWLVFHAETGGGTFEGDDDVAPFTVAFGGKLTLRTPAGMVTDMVLKGPSPVGSPDLRYALAGGLSVKEADLRLEQDERAWSFALAAEHFDLKRVKLPELLTEEDDDRGDERVALIGALDAALRSAFGAFMALRVKPAWTKQVVPSLRAWLAAGT